MAITPHLTPERIIIGASCEKDRLLDSLVDLVAKDNRETDAEEIKSKIRDREQVVSTRIGEGIAVPHAVVDSMRTSTLAMAICSGGIIWDREEEHPVYLIVLLAGNRNNHLALLSEVAWYLRERETYERLLDCRSGSEVCEIFKALERGQKKEVVSYGRVDVSRTVFHNGWDIAREVGNGKVVLYADAISNTDYLIELVGQTSTIVVTAQPGKFPDHLSDNLTVLEIPFKGKYKPMHINFSLLFLLSSGHLTKDDIVVNIFGEPESGYVDSISLVYMKKEFDFPFSLQTTAAASWTGQHILTRVLQLAGELAREGREGKPVGTMFVVGDYKELQPYIRQLIVNPFRGYTEEERNILDPSLEETIKEYAKIDGAFIVDSEGVIMAAGVFISGQPRADQLISGLGARHAAALGITTITSAFSVVLSESTRKITVYHAGSRLVEL